MDVTQVFASNRFYVVGIALLVLVVTGALWFIMMVISSALKIRGQWLFKKDLIQALRKGEKSWDRVRKMAETHLVSRVGMISAIDSLITEGVSGRRKELDENKLATLEGFLKEDKKYTLYAELPVDISSMMMNIGSVLGTNEKELRPLAAELTKFFKKNAPIEMRQKFYTLGGFILGIISIAFSAYAFIYPPAATPVTMVEQPAAHSSPVLRDGSRPNG